MPATAASVVTAPLLQCQRAEGVKFTVLPSTAKRHIAVVPTRQSWRSRSASVLGRPLRVEIGRRCA